MKKQIFIIGGGAAGLVAAISAARNGAAVTILEHSKKCGQKILATGNGKCNLGNEKMAETCYHCPDSSFVEKILSQWKVSDTKEFFEGIGVSIKSRDGYLYPRSEQASSVRELLLMEAAFHKVKIKNDSEILGIFKKDNTWKIQTKGWEYTADSIVVATGSPASNISGSDESGYDLLKSLGHSIRALLPALVPLTCKGVDTRKWAGVRIEAKIQLFLNGRNTSIVSGELQLTDYGISGIPVFQISGPAVRALKEGQKVELELDFMPDISWDLLEKELIRRREDCPYKSERELYIGLLPDKLISLLPVEDPIPWIKELRILITGSKSMKFAQVSSGGVITSEINPNTMESQINQGLYFAGEVMDVDGICGGYNLHWAWATGNIAGRCSAQDGKR